MKTALVPVLLAVLGLTALSSCSTPASRIKKFPELFSGISEPARTFASQGRIQPGMTQDAVFIAWGEPSRVWKGTSEGKTVEDWIYTELEPVYWGPSYGFGYGFGGFYDPFYDFYWSQSQVDYVRVPSAVVRFEEGTVKGWRQRR